MSNLHSNMDRLKDNLFLMFLPLHLYLHSNMDRLKVVLVREMWLLFMNLHSNMDRLKVVFVCPYPLPIQGFTFQYG